jgi:hypothetical protein
VNLVCDHCLLIGYADQEHRIDRRIVDEAIRYFEDGERTPGSPALSSDPPARAKQPRWALGVLGVLLATGGLALTLHLTAVSDWSSVLNRFLDSARSARAYLVP